MTLIVRESPRVRFHTDLREVVAALNGAHLGYRWLLSDIEANCLGDGHFPDEFQHEAGDRWISGARLGEIANDYSVQLIWGVLSGFHPDASPEGKELVPKPVAEPFTGEIQHPDAQIEIVAVDSTFTAIAARDVEVEAAFGRHFSES